MTKRRLNLGAMGEALAATHLEQLGYRILARNYRVSLGEIDIVAIDGDTLVFIEVKTRRSADPARVFEVVTPRKQRQISRVALEYMSSHAVSELPARFDVVGVMLDDRDPSVDPAVRVEVLKGAFDLCYGL